MFSEIIAKDIDLIRVYRGKTNEYVPGLQPLHHVELTALISNRQAARIKPFIGTNDLSQSYPHFTNRCMLKAFFEEDLCSRA